MRLRKTEASWVESRKRWQINVQVDGTRRTFTSSTPGRRGKAQAERKADAWLEEQTTSEATKCNIMLQRYLARQKATTSMANWRPIEGRINNHIAPVLGHRKISAITEHDLQDVIDEAYAKGLSARMLVNIKSTLTAWMKFCRQARVTTLHPESLMIPRGAAKTQRAVADPADLRVLFSSVETTWRDKPCPDRYIHAYRFAVLTGLRPGELLGLRWQDVGEDRITIRQALNDDGEITTGKNDNARRTIVLPGLARAELQQQRQQLLDEGVISEYVFPDRHAAPTAQDTYRDYWHRYRKHNGLKHLTPYEMRHTFVSINKEMPEGLKRLVVGHSQDMDTEGTYGHLMDGDLQAAAGYSDAAFKRVLGTH